MSICVYVYTVIITCANFLSLSMSPLCAQLNEQYIYGHRRAYALVVRTWSDIRMHTVLNKYIWYNIE